MRHLKLMLVALAIMMSSMVHAYQEVVFADETAVSSEVEKLLNDPGFAVGEDFTVVFFFSLSEDRKIQSLSVASPNKQVNEFLQKRFQDQKLSGEKWHLGKIYELSVKKQRPGRRV